jgi:WD40 repeat protein
MSCFWLRVSVLAVAFALPTFTMAQPADPPNPTEDEPDEQLSLEKVRLTVDPGGHTASIRKVLFTPDGKRVITLSADHSIRIWDVETGQTIQVLHPPGVGDLQAAALSSNGKTLAVASLYPEGDKNLPRIYLINLAEARLERPPLKGRGGRINALAFFPDGKSLVSGDEDGSVQTWNLARKEPGKELFKSRFPIGSLAFSPTGDHLAMGGKKHLCWLYEMATGKKGALFEGEPEKPLLAMAWSPDGKTLATGSQDGLRLWALDGTLRHHPTQRPAPALAFSVDSRRVLAVWNEKGFHRGSVFSVDGGKEEVVFSPNQKWDSVLFPQLARDGLFSPDGRWAATTGGGNGIHETFVWRTADGSVVQRLAARSWLTDHLWQAAWSEDGKAVTWGQPATARGKPTGKVRTFQFDEIGFGPDLGKAALRGDVLEVGSLSLKRDMSNLAMVRKDGKLLRKFPGYNTGAMSLVGTDHVVLTDKGKNAFFLYEIATGKVVRRFEGHSDAVFSIAPSPDGRYIVSTSRDQTLRIWARGRDMPLLSLYVSGIDWIVWTPEGYYDASPGGERLMGWVVDHGPDQMTTFHPASRFRARLYRPDVIRLLLAKGSLDKALEAADAARGHVSKPVHIEQVLPPQVTVKTSAKPGGAVQDGKLTIDAEAHAVGPDPITEMQLLIDDRPFTGAKSLVAVDKPEKGPVKASWEVELSPGPHEVRVLARTDASLGTSRGMAILAETDKPVPRKNPPSLYVLAIGIDAYTDKDLQLGGAVNDATRLQKVFQDCSLPLFGKVEPKLILDKEATKKGMLAGLKWLKDNMTANDVAVFFFAGHGALEKGEFYLLPQNGDPRKLKETGLSRREIKRQMQGLPGRVVLMLDACHSGAIGSLPFADLSRELIDEDCGVVVMCAAMSREFALEKATQGYFTRSVIEGLSGKANKRDGSVYVHHLQQYVVDRVMDLSQDRQHPIAVVPPWMRPFGLSKP